MTRRLNPELFTHLQGSVTSVTEAVRFKLDDGRIFGITSLDRDLFFDNMWWRSITGFDMSEMSTDTDLSVDNSEATILIMAMEQDG